MISTGIGSWPGTDAADALKIAFAECPELPYLPELPARGPWAGLIGRGTAFLAGLHTELHATGWRLTDLSGRDQRRAISLLRSDLDLLEEVAQGYEGPVKIAATGPWTLAASLEHPRGDRVLPDRGARRELAQSLAEGLAELVAALRRRLPAVQLVIQLDEPSLPAVLAGAIPTASGLARHRSIDVPEISGGLSVIMDRLAGSDTETWVHCCAPGVPVSLLHQAGAAAVLLDLDQVTSADWDRIGPAMEGGLRLGLGVAPTTDVLSPDRLAARALAVLRPLELDPAVTTTTVLTPACGLAGSSVDAATRTLRALQRSADIVAEELGGVSRIVLQTPRLVLREFTADDVDALYELDADPEVMFFITGGRGTPREEIATDFLPHWLDFYAGGSGYGMWAAEDRGTGEFLGWFHLRPHRGDPPDEPELGYRLRRAAWGRGLASEGSRALVDRAFRELGAARVRAETMTVNTASRRVMEKAGLRFVRTFFAEWPDHIPGDEQGDVEYAITREEWLQTATP